MAQIPAGLTVAVLNYGADASVVCEALRTLGAISFDTDNPHEAASADGLVIPGGVPFSDAMRGLDAIRGGRIIGQRLAGARPVLAIGTGMQVLFEQLLVDASPVAGLGEWPGSVVKLEAPVGAGEVEPAAGTEMLRGVAGPLEFGTDCAVRSFELEEDEFIAYPRVSWARGERFVAAVENGALWATQFHPERSGEAGAAVLRNWLAQLG